MAEEKGVWLPMAGLQKLATELRQEVHVLLGLHIDPRPLNKVCLVLNCPAELKSFTSVPNTPNIFFCQLTKSIKHS